MSYNSHYASLENIYRYQAENKIPYNPTQYTVYILTLHVNMIDFHNFIQITPHWRLKTLKKWKNYNTHTEALKIHCI